MIKTISFDELLIERGVKKKIPKEVLYAGKIGLFLLDISCEACVSGRAWRIRSSREEYHMIQLTVALGL